MRRGIHIGHDLRIGRALRSGDRVRLTAEIAGVGRIRTGAVQHTSFTALDEEGETVWQTLFTNLYLGVDLIGDPQPVDREWEASALRPDRATWTGEPVAAAMSFVRPVDAHVYSECAQIWNPIHTDVAAARRVGLDAPILHGTATLARSVSIAVDLTTAERSNVIGVTGRFRSPVRLGSTITVRVLARDDAHVWFDTLCEDGTPAIADGVITLGNLR